MIADLGTDRPGKPILFSGHCDTVHMTGSFGGPDPTHVEDGKIYGPGVWKQIFHRNGTTVYTKVCTSRRFFGYGYFRLSDRKYRQASE